MAITWRTFSDLVSAQITSMTANSVAAIDSTVGSVTLAFTQAVAGVGLWLQGELAQVLALSRAATSYGVDLDSFYADFEFFRLGRVPAAGTLVYARITPGTQAVVPIGAVATTGPAGLQFQVQLDISNPAYNSTLGGYVLPIGIPSVTVPAAALTAGLSGNVLANTIQSFFAGIPGVDSVNNPGPFTGGTDSETDSQFRFRFPFYLEGLQSADRAAVISAILSTQPGVRWLLVENYDYPGTTLDPGNFFVIIDDGSGVPPPSLVTKTTLAIQSIVALGIRFQVLPPQLLTVNINMTLIVAGTTADHASAAANVQSSIVAYLDTAPLGLGILPQSKIAQLAFDADSRVTNAKQIFINGLLADLILTEVQRPIAGTVTVL